MGHLLAIVVPLACGAAVSPTILALQLLTLSRRTAPLARSWAVAVGCVLVLVGLSVVALLVAQSSGGSDSPDEAGGIVKLGASRRPRCRSPSTRAATRCASRLRSARR
jgi:hypothetical protein